MKRFLLGTEWESFGIRCPTTMTATNWSISLVLRLKTTLLLEFNFILRRTFLNGMKKNQEFLTQSIEEYKVLKWIDNISNFRHAVHVSLYFATHFVNMARRSRHSFKDRWRMIMQLVRIILDMNILQVC